MKQYLTGKQNGYFQIDFLMAAGRHRSDRYRVDCIYPRVLPKKETVSVQGAKKVSFTACHSGKLYVVCTCPQVISTSPKTLFD